MKYSKNATETHQLSCQHKECLQLLSDCLRTEGGKGLLFCKQETCLNLDKIEKAKGKHMPQATMDLTIGLSIDQKNERMLLIELRFNYKSPKNIGEQEIKNKINHSKDLLIGSIIYPDYIFLFRKDQYNQARSHFFRLFKGKNNACLKIMTEEEFHHLFF